MKSLVITAVFTLVCVIDRAASALNEDCGNTVILGKLHYAKSIITRIEIFSHIMVDEDDSIFFRKQYQRDMYVWKKGAPSPVKVQGIEGISTDCAIDDNGKILFTTNTGMYQYDPTTVSASAYKQRIRNAYQMIIASNGTYYFSETPSYKLYFMSPNASYWSPLQVINNGLSLAINSEGDIYYTNLNDNHNYVLLNGHMEAIKILGIRAQTTQMMVIDKRDDILYICTDYGLYWLEPGSYHPRRIPGFNEVYSMGFDRHGNILIAEKAILYKLTLLAADPCITTTSTEVTETFTEMTTEIYEEEVTPDEHAAPLKEAGSSLVLRWWFWICSIGLITVCCASLYFLYSKIKATRQNREQLRHDKERNYDQSLISLNE